jgi:hypothetical protein
VSIAVCLSASAIDKPRAGGHLWVYLNWALGLRALGCRVIWLETVPHSRPAKEVQADVATLRSRLEGYSLANCVALCSSTGEPLSESAVEGCLDFEAAAAEADLLLNMRYAMPAGLVKRFRRSALVDIDPGLLQVWMSSGQISVAQYDAYFTTGETVGLPGARFPDAGLKWHYTPPCVALDWWPRRVAECAPFTTVTHWRMRQWVKDAGEIYRNDKRTGFLPFLDLPQHTTRPLELALCLTPNENEERAGLQQRGWRVRDAYTEISTPADYQSYIQSSLGEFSCAKPSCTRLQNAWVSDRTLCYLASGKPAIVQHTGPSRFLPDCAGLFRFRDVEEAARCLETAASDYERQCGLARALAEEHFDARKVVGRILERAA